MDLTNRTRYDGATLEQPSLVIKTVSREDSGRYSCVLENRIGASESKSAAILTVLCEYQICAIHCPEFRALFLSIFFLDVSSCLKILYFNHSIRETLEASQICKTQRCESCCIPSFLENVMHTEKRHHYDL